jgi:hypothetical protein
MKITIPTSLNEIKLYQYQEFLKVSSVEGQDEDFLKHKMIQIFCEVDLKMVLMMSYKDIEEIIGKISSLFSDKYQFINRFKLDGLDFGFIPNLDNMSAGEVIDLDAYISDWQEMHKAMSILFRPVIQKLSDKYIIEKYEGSDKYSDAMRNMPVDIALGAMVFFWDLGKDLVNSTLSYLEGNPEVMNIVNKHNLENDGDGIHLSMQQVRETFSDLMQLPSYQSTVS